MNNKNLMVYYLDEIAEYWQLFESLLKIKNKRDLK